MAPEPTTIRLVDREIAAMHFSEEDILMAPAGRSRAPSRGTA